MKFSLPDREKQNQPLAEKEKTPMENDQPTPPTRVRIYSHVTQRRFLHIEDALNIGKVRLFGGAYSRGQGMSDHASHYLDVSDARILFHALLNGEQGYNYKEYKGTPPPSPKQPAFSRVLSAVVKGDNVYIELKSGRGRLTATGAITPDGCAQTVVNVSFKLHEARRLAAEVLAYLHAWDVCRMMTFQQMAGKLPAYHVSSATGEPDKPVPAPTKEKGARHFVAAAQPQAVTPDIARPVTRKGKASTSNGVKVKTANQPETSVAAVAAGLAGEARGDLRYGDGLALNGNNATEVQAFQRYVV
jgi:hypothetical protein